jgi:hypothetical protein
MKFRSETHLRLYVLYLSSMPDFGQRFLVPTNCSKTPQHAIPWKYFRLISNCYLGQGNVAKLTVAFCERTKKRNSNHTRQSTYTEKRHFRQQILKAVTFHQDASALVQVYKALKPRRPILRTVNLFTIILHAVRKQIIFYTLHLLFSGLHFREIFLANPRTAMSLYVKYK